MIEVVISIAVKLIIDSLLELFPFWTITIEQLWVFYWSRVLLSCWLCEYFHIFLLQDLKIDFSNIVLFISLIKTVM